MATLDEVRALAFDKRPHQRPSECDCRGCKLVSITLALCDEVEAAGWLIDGTLDAPISYDAARRAREEMELWVVS